MKQPLAPTWIDLQKAVDRHAEGVVERSRKLVTTEDAVVSSRNVNLINSKNGPYESGQVINVPIPGSGILPLSLYVHVRSEVPIMYTVCTYGVHPVLSSGIETSEELMRLLNRGYCYTDSEPRVPGFHSIAATYAVHLGVEEGSSISVSGTGGVWDANVHISIGKNQAF